jgi:hypothetical protein
LAKLIYTGEVVFFVGAGFSIDSEQLSAKRLVRRLLLRLHALEAIVDPKGGFADAFAGTFGEDFDWQRNVKLPANLSSYTDPTVGRLASRYYEVNEWMIQAYATLLQRTRGQADRSGALAGAEQRLAKATGRSWEESFERLPASFWAHVDAANDARARFKVGKLLFLDTVGFMDEGLMAGRLNHATATARRHADAAWCDLALTNRSFRERFRPRHHVLARLAREGLCPTLLTTNFDLLLEGAFRLSGFCWPRQSPDLAPTTIPHFDIIASAGAFYTKGKAFRTATLVKLHGCARKVRRLHEKIADTEAAIEKARKLLQAAETSQAPDVSRHAKTLAAHETELAVRRYELQHYLDEVVFTYRDNSKLARRFLGCRLRAHDPPHPHGCLLGLQHR